MNNSQIKELAEKAGCEWDDKYHWYLSNAELRKFAQVIIEECVEIMKANERLPVGVLQAKSADIHSTVIRAHFGIDYE